MEGARIIRVEARRPDLRQPLPRDFARRLEGQTVTGISRRAKYLTADLASGDVLLMHLGMSGSVRVGYEALLPNSPPLSPPATHAAQSTHPPHRAPAPDHVFFPLTPAPSVSFNAPRRFGLMLIVPRRDLSSHPLMREVGPEPLGNAFDASLLAAACAPKKTSLKAVLLDQTVVAGLGNIYACEALHRARLSPKRGASSIATRTGAPNPKALALVAAIKAVLNDAIKAGGSSLRDHRQTDGELGYFQHHFRVYDREGEPCVTPGCGGTVRRIVQNGRSTFFCAKCQK